MALIYTNGLALLIVQVCMKRVINVKKVRYVFEGRYPYIFSSLCTHVSLVVIDFYDA